MTTTNAIRKLEGMGIALEVRTYEPDEDDLSAGRAAAELGLDPECVFKTLVARCDGRDVVLAHQRLVRPIPYLDHDVLEVRLKLVRHLRERLLDGPVEIRMGRVFHRGGSPQVAGRSAGGGKYRWACVLSQTERSCLRLKPRCRRHGSRVRPPLSLRYCSSCWAAAARPRS